MDVQITCTQTERKNEWEIGDREKKIVTVCPHAIINSFLCPNLLLCVSVFHGASRHILLHRTSLPGDEGPVDFLGVAEGCGPSCYQWGRDDGDHTCPVNIPNVGT